MGRPSDETPNTIVLMASDMKRLIVFLFVLLTLQTVTAGDRLSMLPCHILGGELSNSAATSVQDIDEAMMNESR